MKSQNLRSEWVEGARFTVDLAAFDRLNYSLRVVSDLGRSLEFNRILLVRGTILAANSGDPAQLLLLGPDPPQWDLHIYLR